jgi:hypothetical protein
MEALYSDLNFPRCADEWDYDPHTFSGARFRAEIVRKELARLPGPNVVVIGIEGLLHFWWKWGMVLRIVARIRFLLYRIVRLFTYIHECRDSFVALDFSRGNGQMQDGSSRDGLLDNFSPTLLLPLTPAPITHEGQVYDRNMDSDFGDGIHGERDVVLRECLASGNFLPIFDPSS